LNQDELYQRGAKLMESDSLYDMKQAWTEYLEPLERDYPDHAYKEEVAALRLKWEAAKAPHPSEAQLFFQQGELLHKQGNPAAARQVWRNLIDVFEDVDAEKEWVNRARRALADLEKAALNKDRWKNVRTALERAKELQQQGKLDDAERIWRGIQELYRNDPAAANILLEIERARQEK